MRILLLCHAFNSLSQRMFVELKALGHQLSICIDVNDQNTQAAIDQFQPDLVLAPFLKRAIGSSIYQKHLCWIIHPGPVGERGPSSLDRALLARAISGEPSLDWGVTVLQADAEMDAGPVWGEQSLILTNLDKSACYRNEITEAAVIATKLALQKLQQNQPPRQIDHSDPQYLGFREALAQSERAIDWQNDSSDLILGKIHSAHSFPGLLDTLDGVPCYICDAWPEGRLNQDLSYPAGELIARRDGAVCRATKDGAIWIGHARKKQQNADDSCLPASEFKLPVTDLLPQLASLPESILPFDAVVEYPTLREIWLERQNDLAILHFAPHNGAFSSEFCKRLLQALQQVINSDCRAILLAGGKDFWSNGINLNTIEAADSPADESMNNIQAMDDLCQTIIQTTDKLVFACMQGNAGAGGVFLALAADQVIARQGIVLNPHYKGMGNLFGSEYWTYLLPKRCMRLDNPEDPDGQQLAQQITDNCLPISCQQAEQWQLIDQILPTDDFLNQAISYCQQQLEDSDQLAITLQQKQQTRAEDEAAKPLEEYRQQELEQMQQNFYGFDPSYHVARYNFVSKRPKSRTPSWLQYIDG